MPADTLVGVAQLVRVVHVSYHDVIVELVLPAAYEAMSMGHCNILGSLQNRMNMLVLRMEDLRRQLLHGNIADSVWYRMERCFFRYKQRFRQ